MLQPRQERRSILSQVKSVETQGEKAGWLCGILLQDAQVDWPCRSQPAFKGRSLGTDEAGSNLSKALGSSLKPKRNSLGGWTKKRGLGFSHTIHPSSRALSFAAWYAAARRARSLVGLRRSSVRC
jgi:hypothetical protein